jgi:hypothetical protein
MSSVKPLARFPVFCTPRGFRGFQKNFSPRSLSFSWRICARPSRPIAPDQRYRTSPIGDLFTRFKGGFYHDGRFATLNDVVNHYNTCMNLGLTASEKSDLIQYLLSLTFGTKNSASHLNKTASSSNQQ